MDIEVEICLQYFSQIAQCLFDYFLQYYIKL